MLFYLPGERLSLAELGSARLDGHVVEVGEGYMPTDTIESSGARAMSIAALFPPHAAASGPTAAWVHGAGDLPPAVHHFTRAQRARGRRSVSHRVVFHERLLRTDEVQVLAGMLVTTPFVTAATLLFSATQSTADAHWLQALLRAHPSLEPELHTFVSQTHRRPGSRSARRLLADLTDQEVVTR